MKKIKLSPEFIKNWKVNIAHNRDGSIDIEIDADHIVYVNREETLAASNFRKDADGNFSDETIGIKDLILDEAMYLDYINVGEDKKNYIDSKFKGE